MEFSFETEYNQKSMTVMSQGLRKTIRGKKSRRSHIFGWIIVAASFLVFLLSCVGGGAFRLEVRQIVTLFFTILLAVVLIWEDAINGFVARKRLLPGTEKAKTVFKEEEFVSRTAIGTSTFQYDRIKEIAESGDYFIFVFSISHGQIYDKRHMTGGTAEEFRAFIEKATGKKVRNIG